MRWRLNPAVVLLDYIKNSRELPRPPKVKLNLTNADGVLREIFYLHGVYLFCLQHYAQPVFKLLIPLTRAEVVICVLFKRFFHHF